MLINSDREQPTAPSASPPEIAAKLATAEAEVAGLEAVAALEALVDSPTAKDRLAGIQARLAAARESAASLKAAYRTAVERDGTTIVIRRAALQKTQLAAVRKHLDARDAAAVALSAAIAEVVKHYHTLLDRSAKGMAACPVGTTWPPGSECEPDAIRKIVASELYRASASPGDRDGRTVPGGQLPDGEYLYQPATIPAMEEQIKKASDHVIAKLTGRGQE